MSDNETAHFQAIACMIACDKMGKTRKMPKTDRLQRLYGVTWIIARKRLTLSERPYTIQDRTMYTKQEASQCSEESYHEFTSSSDRRSV